MKYFGLLIKCILLSVMVSGHGYAEERAADKKIQVELLAPGYGELDFEVPKAGSYKLPAFGHAENAKVLNTDNEYVNFHDIFNDKYTILSFMYTSCNDVNGCPLTNVVFNRVKSVADKTEGLSKYLQLVSMSFDPENDTPAVLKNISNGGQSDHGEHDHGNHHAEHGHHTDHQPETNNKETIDWHYLTADSNESLLPILDDYNQSIQNQIGEDGKQSENFSHILRVYLIDPDKNIRNIYSVSFLHPDIIINDVKTLLMQNNISLEDTIKTPKKYKVRVGPGDSKAGYETADYKTNSLSLNIREGQKTDLLSSLKTPPLGLPAVPVPNDNPVTEEKVELGKKLFFDRRLSLNDTISCAMCHIPEQGFTSNEVEKALGFEGRSGRRNAPSIYNTAYYQRLFHDGRETSLENQIWQPLLARNEMANPSIGLVIEKIKSMPDYDSLFEQAFGGRSADVVTIGQAIASYERTLVSANSPFDRWYYADQKNAISTRAQNGFKLFTGKAQCISCHSVNEKFALFTDNNLHNTGLGWNTAMGKEPESKTMLIAPGVYLDVKKSIRDKVGHAAIGDLGYYEITQHPDDRWRYRTPSLRNVALSAPYMHDGSMGTLEQVVEFYNNGGFKNETQSPLINKLNLTKEERQDIVAFLKSLTGDNVADIVADAFTVTVGDTQHHGEQPLLNSNAPQQLQ